GTRMCAVAGVNTTEGAEFTTKERSERRRTEKTTPQLSRRGFAQRAQRAQRRSVRRRLLMPFRQLALRAGRRPALPGRAFSMLFLRSSPFTSFLRFKPVI